MPNHNFNGDPNHDFNGDHKETIHFSSVFFVRLQEKGVILACYQQRVWLYPRQKEASMHNHNLSLNLGSANTVHRSIVLLLSLLATTV